MTLFRTLPAILAAVFILSVSAPTGAVGQRAKNSGTVPQGPIFNPKTNSYFELRTDYYPGASMVWANAHKKARTLAYKGNKGRLAVVKDMETLNFIRENFEPKGAAWIGLRLYCKFRKLLWVTGEIQPLKSRGMWANPWQNHSRITCRTVNLTYMPVHLTAKKHGPILFRAAGSSKARDAYFVEYPVARETTKSETKTKQ